MDELKELEAEIKKHAPKFQLKFKDESTFMKLLSKVLFFNKSFFTNYITTIGNTVYFPNKEDYYDNPSQSFGTLAHEFVHIMDYNRSPFSFVFNYLSPQILALPSLIFLLLIPVWLPLMILSILSPWLLLFLVFLVFLAPFPSYGRKELEIRGYGMSCRVRVWRYGNISPYSFERYVENFISSAYYYMYPFEKTIIKQLEPYTYKNNPSFLRTDPNPAWKVVEDIIKRKNDNTNL